MTQNINIRFLGTANMAAVHKELAGLETKFRNLNATIMSGARVSPASGRGTVDVKFLDQLNQKVAQSRHELQTAISAYNDFGIKSAVVADHTDTLTESIRRQKFGLGDLVREHKNLRDVYRQQMNLRNATVLEWGRNPEGTTNADVITRNRSILDSTAKGWRKLSTEIGFYNTVLRSVSDQTVKWGKNTQWAGRQLMVGITMPVAMAGAATAALAYQVDKGLTQVVKVYGDAATALTTTDEQIKSQTMETARYLADSIGQSVTDTLEITQGLAATGETGVELQRRVAEVSRARLLGELDLQDAMKSTITLQSVYGYSAEQLGDAFNYMNMMENQTVLTMQDFVIGIPKVSGVIKELGGDITEVGTLLAAMKIAGIDAAEGANAIKSIAFKVMAPTPQARDLFEQATGMTFEETVKGTDDVIERLILIGKAMKNIETAPERVDVIAKMFGLYQGSKALSIIGQLTDGSEQMTRAIEVATAGTAEWADTANREVEKLTSSNWNKLQQQWQTLRIDLGKVGDAFLVMAIPILDVVQKIASWFLDLDEGTQNWIIRLTAIGAAIGPIIMLAGLMGNLIGNVGKFTTFITSLAFKFKILNTDEVAQLRIAKMVRSGVSKQEQAYGVLAHMIDKTTVALRNHTIAQLEANGVTPLSARIRAGQAHAIAPADLTRGGDYVIPVKSAAGLQAVSENMTKQTAQQAKWWKKINASTAAWGAVGVTAMASMVTGSESFLGNISDAALMIAMFGPMLAKTQLAAGAAGLIKGSKITTAFTKLGAVAKSAGRGIASVFKMVGLTIAGVAGTIAGIAAAIAGVWWWLNKGAQQTRKEFEKFGKTSETYADVIGYSFREVGTKVNDAGDEIKSLDQQVQEFISNNKEAAKILREMMNLGNEEQIQTAVGEGVKAALTGASKEGAEQAAMIALRVMGSTLSEEEMLMKIRAVIDFGDEQQIMDRSMVEFGRTMGKVASNGFDEGFREGILRSITGNTGLNEAAKQSAIDASETWVSTYIAANEDQKAKMLEQASEIFGQGDARLFQSLYAAHADEFNKAGIKSLEDIRRLQEEIAKGGMGEGGLSAVNGVGVGVGEMEKVNALQERYAAVLRLTEEEKSALNRASEAEKITVDALLESNTLLDDKQKSGITTIDQYTAAVEKAEEAARKSNATMTESKAREEWSRWLRDSRKDGIDWTDEERLRRLNIYRTAAGLKEATHYLQGFNDELRNTKMVDPWSTTATSMRSLINQLPGNDMLSGTADEFFNTYKDTYSGAARTILDEAAAIASNQWDDMADKIADQQAAARDRLDAEHEAAQAAFDRRVKAFDAKWENRMDAFTKKWDRRRESTEKAYDKRIEKIKATIDAEEKAEEIRQRIFEAERTRMARLAEMANRNIDFSAAMNTGNLDEAAKIANDIAATQETWRINDAEAAAADASQARVDKMNKRIDRLEEEKDARLKMLDDIEEREKKQLEDRKDREQEWLDAQKDAMNKEWDARKKSLDDRFRYTNKMNDRERDASRRLLDQKLATLQAWIPKDKKELAQYQREVEDLYKEFGVVLVDKGNKWAGIVGRALGTSSATATKKMANDTNWNALGRLVAENMAEGAFNMSLTDFIKWAAGGDLPASAKVGASTKFIRPIKTADGTKWVLNASGVPKSWHTGGVIGMGGDAKKGRIGKSGSLSNDEVPINALVGEAVLNRRATRNLGEDTINEVNRTGQLPVGLGYGGPEVDTNAAFGIATVIQGFRRMMLEGALNLMEKGTSVDPIVGDDGKSMLYPGGWKRPAAGPVTSRFGYRFHPILRQWLGHTGTDIGAPYGAPIFAAKGGRVLRTGPYGGYGNWTEIGHGAGISTGYGHQSYIKVRPGQAVKTGQVIGRVGSTGRSTGPHLHFEYMKNGKKLNPGIIIPGLEDGGFVVKEGLAQLHEKETVVTRPLSEKLETGIKQMGDQRPIEINFNGPINGIDDLERAMIKVMDKIDDRVGKQRRVGRG